MPKFMDSLKKGVADAGAKAKTLMDVNSLKSRVAQAQRDMEETYGSIGQLTYSAVKAGDLSALSDAVAAHVTAIDEKLADIETLQAKIMELNGEKTCPNCRHAVPLDDRFCPSCGQAQDDEAAKPAEPES